jgi:HEAT repeat protein
LSDLAALQKQLTSSSWKERLGAVRALGQVPTSDTLLIGSALSDQNTAVVREAAEILLRRGDPVAFEPLLRALNAPESRDDAAEEVQEALLELPEAWFIQACIAAIVESKDDDIREFAADALGYPLVAIEATESLERALLDPSLAVREAAEGALYRIQQRLR